MSKYKPKNKIELRSLIENNNIYLGDIDTSLITDMSYLFRKTNRKEYSGIENWNTENVINMESMFAGLSQFNETLYKWDTSKVNNMTGMFFCCKEFNQDINSWNVSNVTNMANMFCLCEKFNQPLDKWNVSNVENMTGMFAGAYNFNKSLNDWDIYNVKYMLSMFNGAGSFNKPLNKWNTRKLENMSTMFYNAVMFNQDLSDWNLDNVSDLDFAFEETTLKNNNKIPIQFIVAEYVTAKNKSLKITQFEMIKNNVKEAYKSIINYDNKIYADFRIMLENEFYRELTDLKTNNNEVLNFSNIEDIENFVNYDKKNNTKLKFIDDIIKEKEIKVFSKDKSKIIDIKIIKYIYLEYFNLKKYIYKIQSLDNIINFLDKESFKNCIREIYINSKKDVSVLVCGVYADDNILIEMYNRENSSILFMKILALHTDSKFALSLLYNVFARHRKASIKKEAVNLLNSIAEKMNLELYELGFKLVYDFGFDKKGEKIIEVNDNKYKISLKNNNVVELFDINHKKQLKSIPKHFPENIKEEIKYIRKEIPNILKSQNYNLIKILISGKKYNYNFWKEIFIDNPIMNKYAVSLIWNLYDKNMNFKTSFRYLGDNSYTDLNDNYVIINENCYISLCSVFDLSKEDITKWKIHLNDYDISQPINQFPIFNMDIYNLEKEIDKLQNMEIIYSSLKAFAGRYSMNVIYEYSESIFCFEDFKKDKFTIKIKFDEYVNNGDIVKINISFYNRENKTADNRFIYYWLVLMISDFKKEELFY
ncbi:BspA family leucine-rich repeat surface protein [Brachyspira murdochii]|uniref:Lipoprotein n=1 Tax=Brachyspira murdochii (strain ATCC 51284 / DSM 12563 / 56-150) TaxID=526224 RepID=D5U891_BRAM5|nr:BspA family leucine-rich repeat surface protein [Brachyspira murdochii]ADG70914.1 lipoprotein [Brachyspira murdochii DSM 12563]